MAAIMTAEYLTEIIHKRIIAQTHVIVSEEAEKAAQEVKKRVYDEIDRIALEVLQSYDIAQDHDRLVITVRKILDA